MVKVGDRVYLKKGTRFYNQAPDIEGVVIRNAMSPGWVRVRFLNGYQNTYTSDDLVISKNKDKIKKNKKIIW